MSWADIKVEGSNKFLKIEGGTYADIHILNEHPKKELVHGGGKDRMACPGEGCNLCDDPDLSEDMRKQERWKTNVWDVKEKKVKIWEFGSGIANQIRGIALMLGESGQTVQDVDFRISATGANKSKRYTIMQKIKANEFLPEDLKLWPL